ncbi:hypothetical protein MLD38_018891 [Melastoma candidum]|uniref:Uncharacterized protein n=1 Tax=Melastoma candidum TaxID=119954 RepID=A0ACB9QUF5_9MYRT|nr:hypothetical protein MLD38_018891 [Melastoma candidum]
MHKARDAVPDLKVAECEGRAVSLLYNKVSRDTVLVTAWSSGQLQMNAVADEVQPVWNLDNAPRVRVNSSDRVTSLAMICESATLERPSQAIDENPEHTIWIGKPPLMLQLAIVDLAHPRRMGFKVLARRNIGEHPLKPVITACLDETPSASPLCGYISVSDSCGYSWLIGVSLNRDCIIRYLGDLEDILSRQNKGQMPEKASLVHDDQIAHLKSSLEKLCNVNKEIVHKAGLVEKAITTRESCNR